MTTERRTTSTLPPRPRSSAPGESREVERIFHALFEASPDVIVLTDKNGNIVLINDLVRQLFGYEPTELIGSPVEVLVPNQSRNAHREKRTHYANHPTPCGMGIQVLGQHKNGTLVPVEVSLSPIISEEVVYTAAHVRDLRPKIHLEEKLRIQGAALDATANNIVITDINGAILWANPSFYLATGLTPQDALGKTPRIINSGYHSTEFFRTLWNTILAGQTWKGDLVNRKKDGQLFHEAKTITPVRNRLGEISHFIAIGQDITARHETEIALQNANQRMHQELEDAKNFVRSLLPTPIDNPAISLKWVFHPSTELGGDALGYHFLPDGRLAIYVLDVCGHGVAPALLSVAALTTLRSVRLPGVDFSNPVSVLSGLNRAFPSSSHNGMFFTAWYGVLDLGTHQLHYAGAGHPPALWIHKNTIEELETSGPMLGVVDDCPWVDYKTQLSSGGHLFIYSDGAYEISDKKGNVLRYEDFLAEIKIGCASGDLISHMVHFAEKRRGGDPFEDDVSMVDVKLPRQLKH